MRVNIDLWDIVIVVFVLLWVVFIGGRILILLIKDWWENRHKDDKDEKRN